MTLRLVVNECGESADQVNERMPQELGDEGEKRAEQQEGMVMTTTLGKRVYEEEP